MLKTYNQTLYYNLLNDKRKALNFFLSQDLVQEEPFGNRVAHHGYLLTSCPGYFMVQYKIWVAVKLARTHKIARGDKIARRYFCTKTLLHEGIKLHEYTFHKQTILHGDIFARVEFWFYFINFFFSSFYYHCP